MNLPTSFDAKTWGPWSAWLALPYAVLLLGRDALFGAYPLLVAHVFLLLLLLIGAVRTIRKQSGGLRLLSGAWGLMAGLALTPILAQPILTISLMAWTLVGLALLGLFLTVAHKEK